MSTTTAGGRCVNCGEVNTLGDCCPVCASFSCDVCGEQIDFDDDTYCEKTDRRMCVSCSQLRQAVINFSMLFTK